ncbi:MAG: hypothetical protein HKO59_07245 [Phycisphaerales bacterium]|nr:hypothetical protein [Phycisphaerales bacterium]
MLFRVLSWRHAATLLAVAGGLGLVASAIEARADDAASAPPATQAEKPARVILRPNRHQEVMGYVELEDDAVIVIRTLDGTLESYAKGRPQIIRLLDPAPGQRGLVILRNGSVRAGVIIEDSFERVVIELDGVRATFKRETVDRIELEPTFEERYEQFRGSITPDTSGRHLALCEWLVDERRYDLAERELVDLLKHNDLVAARRLLTNVRAQIRLAQQPKAAPASAEPIRAPSPERGLPESIISADDVNLIRVYEIDFDRPPNVLVERATIERLVALYGDDPMIPAAEVDRRALFNADPLRVVQLMFALRARELYPEIQVLSEPYALNLFRQRVHNAWLMNTCATSRCHGGPDAGRFFLHRRNSRDARVRYTNLLILERLDVDGEWPLINYERPLDSLIIQYGLPRTVARKPHPDVHGWRFAFARTQDRQVQATVQWIESMLRPRVEYPVEFEPPTAETSNEPTRRGR